MKLELELKTRLEQELEKVEQALAVWEELLTKLAQQLPEGANLRQVAASSTPAYKKSN
ncbi:hypothetical protein [Pedosphaera parvula]|uniref:Uncharacterized protein n=1 Tax=Pedosphaera parvula (strain Ellin514) TaxID=320771 RepID=B9XR42_PEDPL|nr:hypothetical protein [Pedosphaera parvula]EEF57655.1 hypothetical protein Cflav_PD0690 [Pedosphaera parvula Ellin514]